MGSAGRPLSPPRVQESAIWQDRGIITDGNDFSRGELLCKVSKPVNR